MNMINGLKMKQWSFKFGSSKDSTKSKKAYQREVVPVNGASAKNTIVHEIKVLTRGIDSDQDKQKDKKYENGACVKDLEAGSNNESERPDAKPGEDEVCGAGVNDKSFPNGVVDDVVDMDSDRHNVDIDSDIHAGPDEAVCGVVMDKPEIEVTSDLSDDDSILSDSHGINICNYKLKRMALDQNKMNHSKVHVDESEPTGYEEPPFESRDVQIRNGCWITDEYDITDILLGRGKFGEVKQCKERKTGRDLAAKFIDVQGPQDRFDVINEIEMMKSLQHPRLLQLYDVFSKRNNFCLVLELVAGGELFERVINDDFILTEKACIMFMRQICEGIEFMHNNSILHLDLKPENILCLTREGNRIKIIDFGLARKYDPKTELRILFGTPEFMAPEQANFEPIYPSTDMWSIGIICYILLSGLSPFLGESENETIANITEAKWDFNAEEFDSISAEAKDFISKLIHKDTSKRITATECLEHKWLRRSAKRERIPNRSLSTKRLKKFVYRRKWQKAVNAMLALKRMGVKL